MVDTSSSKDDASSKGDGRSASKLRAGEFRTVLHGVNLADLPELLRGRLARYDTNGNGVIDPDELPIPDDDSSISLKAFPAVLREHLDVFDKDGDGSVNLNELLHASDLYRESKKRTKRLVVLSSVLLLLMTLLIGVITGLTAVVVEESKETKVGEGGELTSKTTGKTLATKSSEFSVEGGNVPGAMERKDGSLVGAAQALGNSTKVSSAYDDEFFRELRYLSISGKDNAYLHLQVLGFVRLPARGKCGSTVLLYTMAGQVELDDTTITFDDETAATFADAGFSSTTLEGDDSNRRRSRRLLGLTDVLGFLNAVKSWDFKCDVSMDLAPTSPGVASTYRAVMDVMYPCNMSAVHGDRGSCLDETGGYRPGLTRRNGGNYSIVVRTEIVVSGSKKRRTTKTYPHTPDISLVDVRNQEMGLDFSFQLDITGNYEEQLRPHVCEYTDYKKNICKQPGEDAKYCSMGIQQRKDFFADEAATYANAKYIRETTLDGMRVYEFSFTERHKTFKFYKNFTNGNDPSTFVMSWLEEKASVFFHWESLNPYALKYHDHDSVGMEVVFLNYQVGEAAKVSPSEFAYPKCYGEGRDEVEGHHNDHHAAGNHTSSSIPSSEVKKLIDSAVTDSPFPEILHVEAKSRLTEQPTVNKPPAGWGSNTTTIGGSNATRRNLEEKEVSIAAEETKMTKKDRIGNAGRHLARGGRNEEARRMAAATEENVAAYKAKVQAARKVVEEAKRQKASDKDAPSSGRRKLEETPRQCYNVNKTTYEYDESSPLSATISKYGRELAITYGVTDGSNSATAGCYNLADLPFAFSPCGTNYKETCDSNVDENCDTTPTLAYLEIYNGYAFEGAVKRFEIPDTVQAGTPYEITLDDHSMYDDGVIECTGTIKLYDSTNREGEVLELDAYDGADHVLYNHQYAPNNCSANTEDGVRFRGFNNDDYEGTEWEYWGKDAENQCQNFAKASGGLGGNDKFNSFKVNQLNDCGEVWLCKDENCANECNSFTTGKTLNSYANKYSSWMWHHSSWWGKPLSIQAPPGCILKFHAAGNDLANAADGNLKKTWTTGPGEPYKDDFSGWDINEKLVRIVVSQDDTTYSSSGTWKNKINSLTVPAGCILEYKLSSSNSWRTDDELQGDPQDCTRCMYGGEDGLVKPLVSDANDIIAIRLHQDERTWGNMWSRQADDEDGFGNLYNLPNNCGFQFFKEENCDETGNSWTRYWDHSHLPDFPDSRPLIKSVRLIHNEREDDMLNTEKVCIVPNKGFGTCGLAGDMCDDDGTPGLASGYTGFPCPLEYLYMTSTGDTPSVCVWEEDSPMGLFNFELGFDQKTGLPCHIHFEMEIDTKDIVPATKALPVEAYVSGSITFQIYNDYTGLTSAMGCINVGIVVGYAPLIELDLEIGQLCIGYMETTIPDHVEHDHDDPDEKVPAAFAKLKLWPFTRLGGVWLTAQITAFPSEVDGDSHVSIDLCAGFKVWYVFGSKEVFSTCLSDSKYSSFNGYFTQHLNSGSAITSATDTLS
ncbi:EF-hand domain-containing protein [Pycnococcus provasolii]